MTYKSCCWRWRFDTGMQLVKSHYGELTILPRISRVDIGQCRYNMYENRMTEYAFLVLSQAKKKHDIKIQV